MEINSKQNALRVVVFISMLVVLTSSLTIVFVPHYIVDNILQVFLLEPAYSLLVFLVVDDEANRTLIIGIIIILIAATLTSGVLMFLKKKAGCYCAFVILALDIINRLPMLFMGLPLLIGTIFKIILIIFVMCYMRALKET